jgi:hypothetical protein
VGVICKRGSSVCVLLFRRGGEVGARSIDSDFEDTLNFFQYLYTNLSVTHFLYPYPTFLIHI